VHIGYHKTGSTLLQKHLFARTDLGYHGWKESSSYVHSHVVCQPYLSAETGASPDHLDEKISEVNSQGQVFVLSHERLSGYYANGGFDSLAIAQRLHAKLPGAAVLIVVREQLSIINSAYSQYITDGGVASFRRFIRLPSRKLRRSPEFDPEYFCYHRLVEVYHDLFGKDQVLVLPYEMIKTNPSEFVRRIAEHCGLQHELQEFLVGFPRVNKRLSCITQELRRLTNRALVFSQLNPAGLVESRALEVGVNRFFKFISPIAGALVPRALDNWIDKRRQGYITEKFGSMFSASNKRLSYLIGIDLDKYGYH